MKSRNTIQLEFQQVSSQARTLEQCADELQAVRRQLNTLVDELRMGWAGESAELYFRKCSELAAKLNTSQQNLSRTAGVIKRSAQAYRDAELAAIELAQN